MASTRSQEDEGLSPNVILSDLDPSALDLDLRPLSRSPHPYSRTGNHKSKNNGSVHSNHHTQTRTSSDSGTEADDESTSLLKGLPAPPLRSRKGVRAGWNGASDHDLWLPGLQRWPSFGRSTSRSSRRSSVGDNEAEISEMRDKARTKRRIEVVRRAMEAALLLSVGGVVLNQQSARALAWAWKKGMLSLFECFGLHR